MPPTVCHHDDHLYRFRIQLSAIFFLSTSPDSNDDDDDDDDEDDDTHSLFDVLV